jgi:branched-chain amino acid transport system substrate-binding protein
MLSAWGKRWVALCGGTYSTRHGGATTQGDEVRRKRVKLATAGLVGLALTAAACGSGGGGNSATNATVDKGVAGGVAAALGGSSTTGGGATTTAAPQPTSIDGWEALWKQQRDALVKRISDNTWGKSADGKTLTGPGGWTVDLSKCPAGWSDTEGVSDTSLKLGLAIAQSGNYAEYYNYAKAMKVLFDYYGAQGAFKDVNGKTRKIDFITKDDGYDPARTIPLVDEFLDSDKVFAAWTLGSPNTLKTYDKINQRCVPHPEAITAHAAWGDPVNHPWTTGAPNLSYSSEAILWGSFLEQHLTEFPTDRKVRVAALVANNDFGKLYDASFRAYVAQSATLKDRIDYSTEQIEASTPTITDPMTTLAAKNPDVFIAMVAATPCTQAVTEAAQNGMHEKVKYLFQPITCAGTTFVKKEKVGGDGSAANNWWIVDTGAKDLTGQRFQSDAYVQWARNLLQTAGIDPNSSSLLSGGFGLGWTFVQSVLIADQLPGGLTRTNFILAQRSMDMTMPMLIQGVKFHMDGAKDAYFVEAGQYQQWDSAKQTWVPKTDILDLDGKSKNCGWDPAAGVCK